MRLFRHVSFGLLILCATTTAAFSAGKAGEEAPDFPPGVFSDGQQYRLADLRGKVVVLFMYEKDCPTCRARTTREFNPIVDQYRDKPVKFIAIGAGDNAAEVRQFMGQTQIKMPVYVDAFSIMEKRYGQTISLNNIHQWRVIDPEGKIAGYRPNDDWMEKAIAKASWRFKDKGYHPALAQAVEHFEWNRYDLGMKALKPHRKSKKADVAESAQKLYDTIKAEGQVWKADADAAMEASPAVAFDGYTKLKAIFEGDTELLAGVDANLAKLKTDKAMTAELAARKMMAALAAQSNKPNPPAASEMAAGYRAVAKKYPDSPSGQAAEQLASELGS
ncbi:MAG TPA: redoxin family protein [Tepidisphaeraceae bacterium]|jgi:peroxiredoxin|nr:redoxin family protein [Tepidisphaeraceae bacterium]